MDDLVAGYFSKKGAEYGIIIETRNGDLALEARA
jgi:hypothetical protein